jgi:hypothetical protein
METDAGITRLLQVLYRINFLTIVLCLCMNRPYQFYYFPPLVSFWYLGQQDSYLLYYPCLKTTFTCTFFLEG